MRSSFLSGLSFFAFLSSLLPVIARFGIMDYSECITVDFAPPAVVLVLVSFVLSVYYWRRKESADRGDSLSRVLVRIIVPLSLVCALLIIFASLSQNASVDRCVMAREDLLDEENMQAKRKSEESKTWIALSVVGAVVTTLCFGFILLDDYWRLLEPETEVYRNPEMRRGMFKTGEFCKTPAKKANYLLHAPSEPSINVVKAKSHRKALSEIDSALARDVERARDILIEQYLESAVQEVQEGGLCGNVLACLAI